MLDNVPTLRLEKLETFMERRARIANGPDMRRAHLWLCRLDAVRSVLWSRSSALAS